MYCEQCGKKNEIVGAFCEHCGKPVNTAIVRQNLSPASTEVADTPVPIQIKRKSNSILLAAIIIFISCCLGAYKYMEQIFAPEAATKNFMDAMVSQNYQKALEYIELPADEFLTLDNFKNYVVKINKLENISGYEVIVDAENQENKSVQKHQVIYLPNDGLEQRKLILTLVNSLNKRGLIFDEWKISSQGFIAKNWSIKVPHEAKLYIAGKKIGAQYLKRSDNNIDEYVINFIFQSTYKIKIEQDGYNSFEKEFSTGELVAVNSLQKIVAPSTQANQNMQNHLQSNTPTTPKRAVATSYATNQNRPTSPPNASSGSRDAEKPPQGYKSWDEYHDAVVQETRKIYDALVKEGEKEKEGKK